MTPAEFQALLTGLLCRDEAAFTAADTILRPLLYMKASRFVPAGGCGRECLEEVVQDALWCAFRTVGAFRGTVFASFSAWADQIVKGKALDHLMRCGQRRVVRLASDLTATGVLEVADDSDVLDEVVERELVERVQNGLLLIPEVLAAALRLRVECGLTFKQIASEQRCTEETARWRVFRARRLLAVRLGLNPAAFDATAD